MAVHNAPGHDICSRVFDFISNDTKFGRQVEMEPDFGVNPVHRLDRKTSGILLLATTREMFRFFSQQFESRQVTKRYVAILHGKLERLKRDSAWRTWQWPLSKSAAGRVNPKGGAPRQPSETRYRVIDHSVHYSLAEIEPLTGRTHQIRRHAKLAGHPVVGDPRYGSTRALNYLSRTCAFDRMALHARSLRVRLLGN
ncbi:MAG: RNA pseudouridine synthase, partial [Deltaproteobacteria bacterium]|nr:RNA pseudouridine synthase [Deltaproteobacteria bacterium]